MLRDLSISLIDFFLPRFCAGCSTKLFPYDKFICAPCFSSIQPADNLRLEYEFQRKFYNDKIISGFASSFVFEKDKALQEIMHAIKYNKNFLAGKYLGRKSANLLNDKIKNWNIDIIIPIPLHAAKKFERGYNQSYYIAKGIAAELNLPVKENGLKRIRYTESQTTMTLLERKENIGNAFSVRNRNSIKGKNVLLIDDVITTGATITECGKILLSAGASKIYAASLAIAD